MHILWGGKEQGARAARSDAAPPARFSPAAPGPAAVPTSPLQRPPAGGARQRAGRQQHPELLTKSQRIPAWWAHQGCSRRDKRCRGGRRRPRKLQELWHPPSAGCKAVGRLSEPILGIVGHQGLLWCQESPVPALSCRRLGNHRTVPRLS